MSYGIDLIKGSGALAYSVGDSLLTFLGVLEYSVSGFSYEAGTFSGSSNNHSKVYDRRPRFVSVARSDTTPPLGGGYSYDQLLFFFKGPSTIRTTFSRIKSGGVSHVGFFINGSAPVGSKLRVYCFAPKNPSYAAANSGYGISIYDDKGSPLFTTDYPEIRLQGITSFTVPHQDTHSSVAPVLTRTVSVPFIQANSAVCVNGGVVNSVGTREYAVQVTNVWTSSVSCQVHPGEVKVFTAHNEYIINLAGGTPFDYSNWNYNTAPQLTFTVLSVDSAEYDAFGLPTEYKTLTYLEPLKE
jgi:hypothetical protein